MSDTKRAILDLRGLVLHAYYSDRSRGLSRTGSLGEPVPTAEHAINQFIDKYLEPILTEFQPIQIVAVMEGTMGNARRRRMFPAYKDKPEQGADDEIQTEEKAKALDGCARLLMHLGATLVKTPYTEADDTIAYLCQRLQGYKRVYSRDKDLIALTAPGCEIYISDYFTGVSELRTEFEGMDLTEVPAQMVTLHKSLVGDTSDNYKGVHLFGEKSFPKLLQEIGWDGMEQLCEIVETENWEWLAAAAEGSTLLTKLLTHKEQWHTCWRLAKLYPEWCEMSFNGKAVRPVWGKRIPQITNIRKELAKFNLEDRAEEFEEYCINPFLMDRKWLDENQDKLEAELQLMQQSQFVAFDYESYDALSNPKYREARKGFVDVLNQRITGASFAYGPNLQHSFYIPVLHRDTRNCSLEEIKELLEHIAGQNVVAQNSTFEQVLSKTNLNFVFPKTNPVLDTIEIASHVDEEGEKGLKMLSKRFLNYDQMTYAQVMAGHNDMRDLSGKEVLKYGADDSIVTAHLACLFQLILECEQTWDFCRDNEPYFTYAHVDSFIKGIPLDWDRMSQLREEDRASLQEADAALRELLQTHCSEPNEAGFNTIWPEIRSFLKADGKARARKKDESVDQEAMDDKLEDKKREVLHACQYRTFGPPPVVLDTKTISGVAKSLGFPVIRSVRGVKLIEWVDSMWQQAADQEAEMSEVQSEFLDLLRACADAVVEFGGKTKGSLVEPNGADLSGLMRFVSERVAQDVSFWTGTELNVGSPNQMAMLFYGMMGLPIIIRNTAKEGSTRDQFDLEGAPSTNDLAMQTWLVELDENDWRREAIKLIQIVRANRQRESLYYSKYPLWASPIDGRIHPQFKNCGTDTRRPSGNSPNVLQVSKNKDRGRLRAVFLPQHVDDPDPNREPEVIVSIDWSQEEIRLAAATSKDPGLLACYVGDNRRDVHTFTSTGIMNILMQRDHGLAALAEESGVPYPWDYETFVKVRKSPKLPIYKQANYERDKKGKPTVFTLLYGGSELGLARKLIISKALSSAIFKAFFKTYPGLLRRQEEIIKEARRHGFVTTMFGSRRHVPGILSKDKALAGAIARKIINFEMQGCAADIAKKTMREWVLREVPEKTGATLYSVVYDEIVASVPVSQVFNYVNLVIEIMEITLPGTEVVLEAEASLGLNWGQQIELEGNHSYEHINNVLKELTHG